MSAPSILAECHDYRSLITALRTRIAELNLRCEDIDAAAMFTPRYCAKILGPRLVRPLGPQTMGPMLSVLGLKLMVALDESVAPAVSQKPQIAASRRMLPNGKRRKSGRTLFTPERSRIANARRLLLLSARRRRQIARIAAKARWSDTAREQERRKAARAAAEGAPGR
jgi:hypothetical protein